MQTKELRSPPGQTWPHPVTFLSEVCMPSLTLCKHLSVSCMINIKRCCWHRRFNRLCCSYKEKSSGRIMWLHSCMSKPDCIELLWLTVFAIILCSYCLSCRSAQFSRQRWTRHPVCLPPSKCSEAPHASCTVPSSTLPAASHHTSPLAEHRRSSVPLPRAAAEPQSQRTGSRAQPQPAAALQVHHRGPQ